MSYSRIYPEKDGSMIYYRRIYLKDLPYPANSREKFIFNTDIPGKLMVDYPSLISECEVLVDVDNVTYEIKPADKKEFDVNGHAYISIKRDSQKLNDYMTYIDFVFTPKFDQESPKLEETPEPVTVEEQKSEFVSYCFGCKSTFETPDVTRCSNCDHIKLRRLPREAYEFLEVAEEWGMEIFDMRFDNITKSMRILVSRSSMEYLRKCVKNLNELLNIDSINGLVISGEMTPLLNALRSIISDNMQMPRNQYDIRIYQLANKFRTKGYDVKSFEEGRHSTDRLNVLSDGTGLWMKVYNQYPQITFSTEIYDFISLQYTFDTNDVFLHEYDVETSLLFVEDQMEYLDYEEFNLRYEDYLDKLNSVADRLVDLNTITPKLKHNMEFINKMKHAFDGFK